MKKHKRIGPVDYIQGNPESAEEMVTKYGTYNIQPTNDTINDYPKIAQGLASKKNRSHLKKLK